MSSIVCQKFVQNAWKKERCSNCFKGREDHNTNNNNRRGTATAPSVVTTRQHQNDGIIRRNANNSVNNTLKKLRTVSFSSELTQVIGYGGEEWSDSEEFQLSPDSESSEEESLRKDDVDTEMEQVTKQNTEHNANIAIAARTTDRRRTFTQLMLGQPQRDATGNKQTLLVAVTPFGQTKRKTTVSHIPIAKNKDVLLLAEAKPKVILTAYTKSKDSDVANTKHPARDTILNKDTIGEQPAQKLNETPIEKTEQILNNSPISETRKGCVIGDEKRDVNNDECKIEDKVDEECKIDTSESKLADDLRRSELVAGQPCNVKSKTELNIQLSPVASALDSEAEVVLGLGTVPAESRELSGEPDGRADPQVGEGQQAEALPPTTKPPALPRCPPPHPHTPARVSFLYGHPPSNKMGRKLLVDLPPLPIPDPTKTPNKRRAPNPPPTPTECLPIAPEDPDANFFNASKNLLDSEIICRTAGITDHSNEIKDSSFRPIVKEDQLVRQSEITNNFIRQSGMNETFNRRSLHNGITDHLYRRNEILGYSNRQNQSGIDNLNRQNGVDDSGQNELPDNSYYQTNEIIDSYKQYESPTDISKQSQQVQQYETEAALRLNNIDPTDSSNRSNAFLLNNPTIETRSAIISQSPTVETSVGVSPEPLPRKALSVSHDSLTHTHKDEKRKDKTRTRFSLMKFLRGSGGGKTSDKLKVEDKALVPLSVPIPTPKPRLVIVHPLEFTGADTLQHFGTTNHREGLPPAPPPRNISEKRSDERPVPPPPKSEELLRKTRQISRSGGSVDGGDGSTSDNLVYANLGEVRSGLAPSKPQRTASMREREAAAHADTTHQTSHTPHTPHDTPTPHHTPHTPHTPLTTPTSTFKPTSLPVYSCSESELELSDNDVLRPCKLRSRKGRSIVHRSLEDNYGAVVVANHEALAQVLEQLGGVGVGGVPVSLRGLQSATALRWRDFSVVEGEGGVGGVWAGRRSFHRALYAGAHHVTLAVCPVTQHTSPPHYHHHHHYQLPIITEFTDLVAASYLPPASTSSDNTHLVQATIAVLPWMQIDTIESVGAKLRTRSSAEATRDATFVLLQLVNSLKGLQAQGIEELPLALDSFVLCQDVEVGVGMQHQHHRLCLLQGGAGAGVLGTLCQCANTALELLCGVDVEWSLGRVVRMVLGREGATSLSQVKALLELELWGPLDVALSVADVRDREQALQRWLDLERATVLHGLVARCQLHLSILEHAHLLFLVHTSAKIMCEASLMLDNR